MEIKKGNITWIIIISLMIIATILGALFWKKQSPKPETDIETMENEQAIDFPSEKVTIPKYKPKKFEIAATGIKGLSKNQIDQHITLYAGYVKKRNQIEKDLETVNRKNSASRTYSPFRSLKVAETYALNGSILHELYFENISITPTSITNMGPQTKALIEKSFGSVNAFKKDFMDSAGVARGWVLSCYVIDNGLLHNYVLDEHNVRVPILVIPLLVLDVYEHAYMIDYGIHRKPYLDVFWNHINWGVVETRIAKWVNHLKKV